MQLVFATNNSHKLDEIRALLSPKYKILSLADIGFNQEIEETGSTLEENADIKSKCIHEQFDMNCFSDDTGLEVEALHGAPGVYSARYAGENCSFDDNMNKLLDALRDETNRKAQFRTVISLIINGEIKHFEGIVKGEILASKKGGDGFGYDPIFQAKGYELSFAEMSREEKNKISHRGRAVQKLVSYLSSLD